ncbi:hypothetical protein ABIA45_003280 [Bradyrhizobium sp. USDA 336]
MLIAASGVVELVGERGSHLAHRGQPRHVHELGLQLLEPRLGLLVLGEVAHEAGEIGLARALRLPDGQVHRERRAVAAFAGHDAADADDVRIIGPEIAREIAVVTRLIGFRHENAHVSADRFLPAVAEQPLRGAAEELHDAA